MQRSLFLIASALAWLARPGAPAHAAALPKQLATLHPAPGAIQIDGRLDERAWAEGTFDDGFVEKRPVEGASPAERTEIAIAIDGDALVVGARMTQAAGTVRAGLTRRDVFSDVDSIAVSLDAKRDHRTAYTFGVTAAGARFDHFHPADREDDLDASFDPVWQAAAVITPTGWTAELRIPLAQIPAAPDAADWGVNLTRRVAARGAVHYWQLISSDRSGWASGFGALVDAPRGARRAIEVTPYAAASVTRGDARDQALRGGGEVRVPLGAYALLTASVLPDFGQVEADPAELNLTTVETLFVDRRPLFVEQRRLFEGGAISDGVTYFYSRRIGGIPREAAARASVGAPSSATLLGAAKLTARSPQGLTVGALAALTDRAAGPGDVGVAPRSVFAVVRAQQELGDRGSTIGAIATGVARDLASEPALADVVVRTATAAGVDWELRLADGALSLSGDVGASRVAGTPAAIAVAQASSARYLQRPDLPAGAFDPARRSLIGTRGALRLARVEGAHWLWSISGSATTSGFDLDDAGALAQADRAQAAAWLMYRDNHAGGPLRRYEARLIAGGEWNLEGDRVGARLMLNTRSVWRNDWEVFTHLHVEPRATSDRETRGGPRMRTPRMMDGEVQVSTDPGQPVRGTVHAMGYADEVGGRRLAFGASISYGGLGRVSAELQPSLTLDVGRRQYVAAIDDADAPTFGRHYVFGELRRNTVSVPARVGIALTPGLTLDLYAEPYVTSGRYAQLGALAASGGLALARGDGDGGPTIRRDADGYLVGDGPGAARLSLPDFDQVALRSTAVVRWEWAPGATAFLVWQQDRAGRPPGAMSDGVRGGDLLGDLFSAPGSQTIAIKLSYWFAR